VCHPLACCKEPVTRWGTCLLLAGSGAASIVIAQLISPAAGSRMERGRLLGGICSSCAQRGGLHEFWIPMLHCILILCTSF
jgi:hypothetical protein